jgi:hypothetical protein
MEAKVEHERDAGWDLRRGEGGACRELKDNLGPPTSTIVCEITLMPYFRLRELSNRHITHSSRHSKVVP